MEDFSYLEITRPLEQVYNKILIKHKFKVQYQLESSSY